MAQADNALARAQELRDRGFLSQAGLDTAIAQQATAQAQVSAASAARAEIDVGAQAAIVVPTQSILYRENRAGVFVLDGEGRARFQMVTVLSRSDDFSAVDGLQAGARVVVEGAGFLGDGDRVTIAPAQ